MQVRCALLLAVALVACGEPAPPPPPPSAHLFDRPVADTSTPASCLTGEVARAFTEDSVWIVDEHVEAASLQVHRAPDRAQRYRWTTTRFPVSEARIVAAADAAGPGQGRPVVDGERWQEVPGPDDVRIGPRGVRLPLGGAVRRDAWLEIAYPTSTAELIARLVSPAPLPGDVPRPAEHTIGGSTRRALLVPPPSSVTWATALPAGARLTFGCGLVRLAFESRARAAETGPSHAVAVRAAPAGAATFRVVLDDGRGTPETVFEHEVVPAAAVGFLDFDVDLSAWSDRAVQLSFQVEAEDAGAPVFPFWAEPVVAGSGGRLPPDVLVLLIDTLRADRLGCYGWERARTPVIDALARRGVRYADVTAAGPWTLPSHASLFTSLHASQHGLFAEDRRLPTGTPTLAEVLRDHGYATAAFTEGGFVRAEYGFARGFDEFSAVPGDVAGTFERAAEWIEGTRSPYFAFVQTYRVHSPFDPPQDERAALVRAYDGPLPTSVHPPDFPWGGARNGPELTDADVRYLTDLYDAEIAGVDKAVGDLLDRLRRAGRVSANTLVVVTSDHGEEFRDHGHYGHGFSLYQEQLHVPWILAGPGFEGGRTFTEPVLGIDLAPTLARATGAPIPVEWRGEALVGDEVPRADRELFVPYVTRVRAERAAVLRHGALKYVDYPLTGRPHDPANGNGLFDLAADPREREDAWASSAFDWGVRIDELWDQFVPLEEGARAERSAGLEAELRALGYAGDE